MALGLLSVLTACGGSTVAEVQPSPPPSLTAPCRPPVALPDRAMSQVEVEVAWGRDRTSLRNCGAQLQGLAAWPKGS